MMMFFERVNWEVCTFCYSFTKGTGLTYFDSLFLIVLPEVSNSHRAGHPPLPPPSSLHNLKITEVGEGGGATSFGEKVGDGGGSTAATSFLWSHF